MSCYSCAHLNAKDCGKIKGINYNGAVVYEKIQKNCKGYEVVKKWDYLNVRKK